MNTKGQVGDENPEQWSAADKLAAVLQASGLSGSELGSFCRERGLYPKQVVRWRQAEEDANGPNAPSMADQRELQRKNQEQAREIRRLQREPDKKEKALTEAAVSAIYAVYEARDARGAKAHEPRMMVLLLLHAYCVGIRQEFLGFLCKIEKSVSKRLDVHLIVDNYCTHKHANAKAWQARRPHFHVHYTPTYASWLNQVERWFEIITQRAIRRGNPSSVKELIAKIEQFVAAYDKTKAPLSWTATADTIPEKP